MYGRIAASDNLLTVVLGVSGSGKSSLVKAGLIPYLRKLSKTNNDLNQWHILNPIRPGESPFAALARTIWAIADLPTTVELDSLGFLSQRLNQKIEQLQPKIAEASRKHGETSRTTQRLKLEAEKFTQITTTWNQDSDTAKQLLIVEHFETLYALCATETESESQQQQQLKQIFLACLNLLTARLQSDPNSFVEIVKASSQKHPGVKLLLVIDQFEELITLGRKAQPNQPSDAQEEWQQFLQLLETTLAANLPQLCIVITLRSDFEPRFLNSEALKSYWTKARFPVRAMRSDELREAIAGPASEMALYFEPANLVDRLIDEVGQMPGALPLLSFTLSELYIKLANKWKDGESSDRALTVDAEFDKEGGVAGSLTRTANDEYKKIGDELGETVQQTMRRVMLRMLTLEGGETARRRVPESELVYPTKKESDRVKQVVERLVEARLLVKGQLETGEPYVEAAHDFLVRGWGTLQEWIDEEKIKETLELQQRLTAQANDWHRNNRADGLLLLDRDRLNFLEKILKSTDNWLNQRENEFINSSIKQVNKLQARPDLLQKADRVQSLLLVQPLNALILAIQAMGQNLETLPDEKLSPVQNSLHQAMGIARERNIFQSHESSVYSVAISLSGDYIVSGSWDKTVRVWDLQGNQIHQPLNHEDSVASVAISSNGHYIVSSTWEGKVYVWKIKNDFEQIHIVQAFQAHEEGQISVAISSDGQYIASGSDDSTVRLWDRQGNQIGQSLEHSDRVTSVAISSDGQYIASGSSDGVRLSNAKGEQIAQLLEHGGRVSSVAMSSNGKYIVSGSWDGKVYLWNINGKQIGQPFHAHDAVWSVDISPDGQYIVSGGEDNLIRLWNKQGKPIGEILRGHKNYIRSVAISLDGQYVVSGSEDGTVRLWDTQTYQISQLEGHKREVTSVATSRDREYIVSISNDNTVRLWNQQGQQIHIVQEPEYKESLLRSVAISPDGQYIAIGSEDTTVRLYNSQGELQGKPFKGHTNYVTSVAIEPDAQYIVSASEDGTVRLWNRQGQQISQAFDGHQGSVYSVTISSDGQYIISGGEDKTVRLWDWQENQIRNSFNGHEDCVTSVAMSIDRKYIVSGSKDTTVRLWNTQGEQIAQPFRGHNNSVNSVAISPDSQYIVSGGEDGTVRLWDIQGNQIGQPFRGHEGSVYSIVISSDGQYIISGGFDKTVRLWRCGNWEAWLQTVCDRIRYHSVFTNPQTEIEKQACQTCRQYVWSKEDISI